MLYRGPFFHDGSYQLTPSWAGLRASPRSRHSRAMLIWVPLALTQSVWWAAILMGLGWAVFALLLQSLFSVALVRNALPSWSLLWRICASGLLIDASTVAAGAVQFRDAGPIGLPLWLLILWLSFALTVPTLQQLISQRRWQLLLLATGGPLAYLAGAALGAATVISTSRYVVLLICGWLFLSWYWHMAAAQTQPPRAEPVTRLLSR